MRSPAHCRVTRIVTALVLWGVLALVACSPRAEEAPAEPELQTVEVEESVTAGMGYEDDARGRRSTSESLLGVLPSDVPRELPLPAGAAVIDFGAEGERWIVFAVDAPVRTVRKNLEQSWQAAGWRRAGEEDVWTRGAERVQARLEERGSGTRLRLDY